MIAVPDFFQEDSEEALRSQVKWQQQNFGLKEDFFARLLPRILRRFAAWEKDAAILTREQGDVLRDWWRTVLHLLSFQHFEAGKVRGAPRTDSPGTNPD